jgi:hypothetical protein
MRMPFEFLLFARMVDWRTSLIEQVDPWLERQAEGV